MQAEVTFNAQASEHIRLTLSNNVGTTMNAFATVDAIQNTSTSKSGNSVYLSLLNRRITTYSSEKAMDSVLTNGMSALNSAEVRVRFFTMQRSLMPITQQRKADSAHSVPNSARFEPVSLAYLKNRVKTGERLIGVFLTASYAGLSVEGEFNFWKQWCAILFRIG